MDQIPVIGFIRVSAHELQIIILSLYPIMSIKSQEPITFIPVDQNPPRHIAQATSPILLSNHKRDPIGKLSQFYNHPLDYLNVSKTKIIAYDYFMPDMQEVFAIEYKEYKFIEKYVQEYMVPYMEVEVDCLQACIRPEFSLNPR